MRKLAYYLAIFIAGTVTLLLIPEQVFAKDIVQALSQTNGKARDIFMQLAPIGLVAAGGAFLFSKQLGQTLLLGAGLGMLLFAGRNSIFTLILNLFS